MNLDTRINADYESALKAGKAETVSTLRLIKTSLKNAQIEKRDTLTEEEILKVIQKEAKQRRDSIESFRAAGRDDLVDKEQQELELIEHYLPAQLSDDDLTQIVTTVIAELGASGMQDMGRVMGEVNKKVSGQADGGRVATMVREKLSA